MLASPTILLCSLAKLRLTPFSDSDAIIFLNVSKQYLDSAPPRQSSPLCLSLWMNDTFPLSPEEEAKEAVTMLPYATIEDFTAFNDFMFCVSDYKRVYIVHEVRHEPLAFVLYLGALLNFGFHQDEAMYRAVKSLPTATPGAIWPVMCLDKSLEAEGSIITAYNDYYATRTVVSPNGIIAEGRF